MAVTETTVRRIMREELATAVSEIERLVAAETEEQDGGDRLLSVDEAAAYLGNFPVTTLRNLVKKKQIGHVKLGRTTAFKREDLDAYIDAHTVKVVEQSWGLTEQSLRTIREGSPRDRVRRRTEAMNRLFPG